MGNLSALRIVRMTRTKSNVIEHPQLEALVEAEFAKVSDGYHLARWIVPLVGVTIGGIFLPIACFANCILHLAYPKFMV